MPDSSFHLPANLRIVVVDDDEDTRTMFVELLLTLGHEAVAFASAEGAWMYQGLDQVDLFLLDIGLPGLDGITFGRSLRNTSRTRHAMVVAVSGSVMLQSQVRSAGFDDFIAKPLTIAALQRLLLKAATLRAEVN